MVTRSRPRSSSSGGALTTPATKTFVVNDWIASDDHYALTMTAAEHGRGNSPVLTQVEQLADGEFCDVGDSLRKKIHASTGAITLYVNRNTGDHENRFAGRIIVW